MLGASLSEVWGDDFKPKKVKKKKIKHSAPLTPGEMDAELLVKDDDKKNFTTNEYQRAQLLKEDYDDIYIPRNSNVLSQRYPYGRMPSRLEEDPDYREFMEFKRMKKKRYMGDDNITSESSPKHSIVNSNTQFNELLLYIFTGFFLLLLYDNIYRFGKNSY